MLPVGGGEEGLPDRTADRRDAVQRAAGRRQQVEARLSARGMPSASASGQRSPFLEFVEQVGGEPDQLGGRCNWKGLPPVTAGSPAAQ